MGSRLGKRVIHFANLPIKLLMPTTFNNIKEIALKTIPSASKIEIRRVLESLYGFEVDEVRTLNMEGKKKKRGGLLYAKPDYKKAYVTLKHPLSISPDLYPIRVLQEEKQKIEKQKASIVDEQEGKSHWLDGSGNKRDKSALRSGPGYVGERADRGNRGKLVDRGDRGRDRGNRENRTAGTAKFPWSNMRSAQ